MSLSLNVPEVSSKPLLIAETRSHKISEFIARIRSTTLIESAGVLFEEMEILNRQKVSAEDRLRALDAYRPTVIELCRQLADHYCSSPLPLHQQAKSHASAAEALWLELSYGYKLALIDNQKKFFSTKGDKHTAVIVLYAMEALRELAMLYHQTYFALPASMWSDLNQMYLYAAQQSLHQLDLSTDETTPSSISLSYKKIVLMALSDPHRLSNKDIKRVADYLERHAGHARLQGLGLIDNPAGIFFIELHSDKPPVSYSKNKKEGDAKQDILLVTVELARLLHKHIMEIKALPQHSANGAHAGDVSGIAALTAETAAEDLRDPLYLDLLTYLIKHWSESPRRIFDRTRKNESMEIGIGISAAHTLYQDTANGSTAADTVTAAGISYQDAKVSASRWVVLNFSAGGVALRKPPNIKENLRIGSLISMRESSGKHWSVGVVRWAANNHDHQIDIGTQLIAPAAKAVALRKHSSDDFQKALVLPGITVLKQSMSIIAPGGTYSPAGQLEIEEAGKLSRIVITKLLERTASFEQFNFSYL